LGALKRRPAIALLETALDFQCGVVEIDVFPSQRQKLAAPHSRCERECDDGIKFVGFQLGQDASDLLGREYLELARVMLPLMPNAFPYLLDGPTSPTVALSLAGRLNSPVALFGFAVSRPECPVPPIDCAVARVTSAPPLHW
jgi:hypothetical protein